MGYFTILAERERLEAENARLRDKLRDAKKLWGENFNEISSLDLRLRKANALLEEIGAVPRESSTDLYGQGWNNAVEHFKAIAARAKEKR